MGDFIDETGKVSSPPPTFGKAMRKEFLFDPSYRNLNHGSFGTIPRHVQRALRCYQDQAESRPDPFIRYTYQDRLRASREAVARLLNAPPSTVVLVPNATTAINTVLRNLAWHPDGRDEILYFDTVYTACGKTIDYIVDEASRRTVGSNDGSGGTSFPVVVSAREIPLTYPLEDAEVVSLFRAAVDSSRREGKRPAACVFDVVSSVPGVRFPFEALVAACRDLGVASIVDGAHGIGMVALDLAALDPDYFVSNCHKWLHVPRACAVFYVPERNQGLMASTVPTSHGYEPLPPPPPPRSSGVDDGEDADADADAVAPSRFSSLPPRAPSDSHFVANFSYFGTIDGSPYLCVKDAIEWRESVGGEAKIREYTHALAREGGRRAAAILGTWVMDNKAGTMTRCSMVNVALPIVMVTTTTTTTTTTMSNGGGGVDGDAGADANADADSEKTMTKMTSPPPPPPPTTTPAPPPIGPDGAVGVPLKEASVAVQWMEAKLMEEHKTFVALFWHGGRWFARLSAQIYLDEEDFEWIGHTLKAVCDRVGKREYR